MNILRVQSFFNRDETSFLHYAESHEIEDARFTQSRKGPSLAYVP